MRDRAGRTPKRASRRRHEIPILCMTVSPSSFSPPSCSSLPALAPPGRMLDSPADHRFSCGLAAVMRASAAPAGPHPARRAAGARGGARRQINAVRHEHGLKLLRSRPSFRQRPRQHTREMGAQGYFEHESFDSTRFWKRIERWYPSNRWRTWSVGENLLYSSPDLDRRRGRELWMSSPGHRANLLSRSWREIGVSAIHFESPPASSTTVRSRS